MHTLVQDAFASSRSRETIVSFRHLRKDYGAITVVPDFSLEIRRGELVCLLGPSGCGKTTTLRMLAGFIPPTGGEILIDGQDVTRVPAYRRDVGIVFQNYALFPHMTVAKNVEYGLVNIGMKRGERIKRVDDMLRRVELQHLSERYPASSRAASNNALRWRERLRCSQKCCSSMSPSRTWMRSCACDFAKTSMR